MNVELIGTIASIIVLISFIFSDLKLTRIINILGSIVFIIYGILINSFSIWFLNGMLLIINTIKLIKRK